MDKHLNIFNSYKGATASGASQSQQLEDNVTRALIIVLQRLHEDSPKACKLLIRHLSGIEPTGSLGFDLQAFSNKGELRRLQKSENLHVILISRHASQLDWLHDSFLDNLKLMERLDESERKRLRSLLEKSIANQTSETFGSGIGTLNIEPREAHSLWKLLANLHDARPDAWVYETRSNHDPIVILLESKVGLNTVSREQIYRHITSVKGLGMSNPEQGFLEERISYLTWSNLAELLKNLEIDPNTIAKHYIDQLHQYLKISGEIMDLSELNNQYDVAFARQQFSLLLERLDEPLKKGYIPLFRRQRRKIGLWDFYSPRSKDGQIEANPDLGVSVSERCVSCALRVNYHSNKKAAKLILHSKQLGEVLKNIQKQPEALQARYWFGIARNRFVDHINGQQTGESYRALEFWVNLKESVWHMESGLKRLIAIADMLLEKAEGREVYLEMRIDWVDLEKVRRSESGERQSPLRVANYELFSEPDKLVDAICEFANVVTPLIDLGKKA